MTRKISFGLILVVAISLSAMAQTAGKSAKPAPKKATAAKTAAKAGKAGAPDTVLHIITLRWKSDATAEQKKAVLDGVKKMADQVPGIKNVWIRTVKVQGGTEDKPYNAVIAMEFVSEDALKAYSTHPAHDEWYKIYLPIRDESRTHDVSN